MEGVGVVLPVGDPLDGAVTGPVQLDEPAGQPLGGGGDEGEVEAPFGGLLVHAGPHVGDDLQAQHLGLLALPVVDPDKGLEGLGQADEAHGEGAVPEHLPHLVVPVQLVAVQPHPLAHEEGVVVYVLAALDLKALQQLLHAEIQHPVQPLEEDVQIPPGLDGQPGQVDGGEGQVAPAVADLPAGIVHVADDPGTAAHIGDFGLRVAGPVVLQVEGRVEEGKIGEQPLGAYPAGQLEQIIVGLSGIIVDAFLYLKDMNGENRSFSIAQAGFCGKQNIPNHHAALGSGIHAVINGAERDLSARPGMHSVQVVDESLHRLVGRPVGFRTGVLKSKFLNFFSAFSTKLICENLELRLHIGFAVFQLGNGAGTFFRGRGHDFLG